MKKAIYKITIKDEEKQLQFKRFCDNMMIVYRKYPEPITWAYSILSSLTKLDIEKMYKFGYLEDMPKAELS